MTLTSISSSSLFRFGIRTGLWLGCGLNLVGATVKLLGGLAAPATAYWVSLAGQGIAATAQPFVMFMPTKV